MISRWYRLLLLLPCLLLAWPATAIDLDVQREDSMALTHGEMTWLRDPGSHLSLDQVLARQADFKPFTHNFSMGYTRDAFWLRLPVHREQAASAWWLDVRPASLDELTLYTVAPDGHVSAQESGDHVPMSQRVASYANYLFRLDVASGDSVYYLRVRTDSSMVVIPRLVRADSFPTVATTQYLQSGLYLGVIFTVLILAIVYLFIWRRRLYMAYVAYLMAQMLFILSSSGFAAQYLFLDSPHVSQRLGGFGLSAAISLGMLFFARLLDLRQYGRLAFLPFMGVAVVAAATALASLIGAYGMMAPWMLAFLHVAIICALPALNQRVRDGSMEDRIFALAFLCFAFFFSGATLRSTGLIPVTEMGMMAGKIANVAHFMLLQVTIMLRSRSVENEALLVRQEAEQRQRVATEQEQFLAMITHEIRTPLSVINAASESLRMIDPNATHPDREQRYDRIANAIRRVDQLLDLPASDNLESPERELQRRVDVVAMTRELLAQMVDEQLGRAQLRVTRQEVWVEANPSLLHFSLLNLIDNACKYSPQDSPIELDIMVTEKKVLRWLIQDHGPGVCEEDRERIFEKYFRSAEHSRKPGLGLGLYLARGLVQRIGGRLNYYDRQGGGACFEIRLPLSQVQHG